MAARHASRGVPFSTDLRRLQVFVSLTNFKLKLVSWRLPIGFFKGPSVLQSVSVPMPPPSTDLLGRCRRKTVQSLSVHSVSTSIIWYTLVSNQLSLQSVKKSPFRVTIQEKLLFGCLWLRSRIRQALWGRTALQVRLFQYIFLFALYQSLSSNSRSSGMANRIRIVL